MKALRNLAPFRWWRSRHALPLVVHGPQTEMQWLSSEIAASIERSLYGPHWSDGYFVGLNKQVARP